MSEKSQTKTVPAKKETENKTPTTPTKKPPAQDGSKNQEQQPGRGNRGGDRGGHQPRRGGGGGLGGGGRGRFNRNFQGGGGEHYMSQRNQYEVPFEDLPTGPKEDLKFTGRCRLFVGNLTPDCTEEEFKEMFSKFGEISEVFVNGSKAFGFIRLVRILIITLYVYMSVSGDEAVILLL